jgi:anti-sigma-K factor RskA
MVLPVSYFPGAIVPTPGEINQSADNGKTWATITPTDKTIPGNWLDQLAVEMRAIEVELGTDPAGSLSTLADRLAVSLNADGTIRTITTKGDLLVYGSTPARLPVGADGYVLVADAAQALGVRWAASNTPSAHAASHAPGSADTIWPTNGVGYLFNDGVGGFSYRTTTSTPGGSSGQVQINVGGSFAGSNNLTWDNTNGRLGIGLGGAAPNYDLEVAGDIFCGGSMLFNDNVGIGIATATGDLNIGYTTSTTPIAYTNGGNEGLIVNATRDDVDGYLGTVDFLAARGSSGGSGGAQMRFLTQPRSAGNPEVALFIGRDGAVGINMATAPTSRLNVGYLTSTAPLSYTNGGNEGLVVNATRDDGADYLGTVDILAARGSTASVGGTQLRFWTQPRTTGNPVAALTIDKDSHIAAAGNATVSGNVGVGVTPTSKLHVENTTSWNSANPLVSLSNVETGASHGNGLLIQAGADSNSSYSLGIKDHSGNVDLIVTGDGLVGIGTGSPNAALEVATGAGSANGSVRFTGTNLNSHFYVGANEDTYLRSGKTAGVVALQDSGGFVGIGTYTPGVLCDIKGDQLSLRLLAATATSYVNLAAANGTNQFYAGVEGSTSGGSAFTGTVAYSAFVASGGPYPLHLCTNLNVRATVSSDGNLGVGVLAPTSKLHVENTIGWDSANPLVTLSNVETGATYGNGLLIQAGADNNGSYSLGVKDLSGNVDLILTGDGLLGIGTGSPLTTLSVNGGVSVKFRRVSSDTTALASDYVIAMSANIITLPPATNAGQIIVIKNESSSSSGYMVRGGSDKIRFSGTGSDSTTNVTISTGCAYTLVADGVDCWDVIAQRA